MLQLSSSRIKLQNFTGVEEPFSIRISENAMLPGPLRRQQCYIARERAPHGFGLYLALERDERLVGQIPSGSKLVVVPDDFEYLGDGDVVRVNPSRTAIRTLYRRSSPHNFFLVTEQCNNYCLMCSQPPKVVNDRWLVGEILDTLPLLDPATSEIGFTGGEPTLLGDEFFRILRSCKSWLPNTAVHILSNGRRFADPDFAADYAAVRHPNVMVGIPLYSDLSTIHDYVVQADGAYDNTVRGILNLKRLHQRVEVRVVLHQQTYRRLPHLAEFIARNLLFVDHVALMGLEITGFTRANLADLWIDPFDYQEELRAAVGVLAASGINVSIYNHQLCVLDPQLWRFARRSISDWKNEYMPECDKCALRDQCGGFFSSSKLRYSDHIKPFTESTALVARTPR